MIAAIIVFNNFCCNSIPLEKRQLIYIHLSVYEYIQLHMFLSGEFTSRQHMIVPSIMRTITIDQCNFPDGV